MLTVQIKCSWPARAASSHYKNILKKGIKELKRIKNLVYLIVKDTILYSVIW